MELLGNSKLTGKFYTIVPKLVRKSLKLDAGDLFILARHSGQIVVKRGRVKVEP